MIGAIFQLALELFIKLSFSSQEPVAIGKVYSKWSYACLDQRRANARVHEKVLVLFRESFNAATIFLQLRHFLLDVLQEVRAGPIKSKLPYMSSTCCCDLLSQLN